MTRKQADETSAIHSGRTKGLVGETVLIKDRLNGTLLARASYVLDRETGRYCGPPGITFSTRAFVADVLGL